MLDFIKSYIVYGLGALAILGLLWLWHEKDKEADALALKLEQANAVIQAKDEERDREQSATTKRDTNYEEQDKKLDDITRRIRQLAKSNEELKNVLLMSLSPDALRVLRGYKGNQHETTSTGTPAQASQPAGSAGAGTR